MLQNINFEFNWPQSHEFQVFRVYTINLHYYIISLGQKEKRTFKANVSAAATACALVCLERPGAQALGSF